MDDPSVERRALIQAIKEIQEKVKQSESFIKQTPSQRTLSEKDSVTTEELERSRHTLIGDHARLAQLRAELDRMDARAITIEQCREEALAWLNSITSPSQFTGEFEIEPPSLPGEDRETPRRKIGKRILNLRDEQPQKRFTDLDVIKNVRGLDDAGFNEIVNVGCRRIRPQIPAVRVLIPVRLETRFDRVGSTARWRLRVRVIPSEPSIDRHDPLATNGELDDVEALWQATNGALGPAGDPQKAIIWRGFVDRHGGPRAAWLVRTFPPLPPDATNNKIHIARPAVVQTEPQYSKVRGFPPVIELWMSRGGGLPFRFALLNVKQEQLRLDFPDPTDATDKRWWSSWEKAVEVGLAIELIIDGSPADIDVIYAIGLSTENPAALFQAHRDSGELAVLELGTPTNTVSGKPAADLGNDPETWLKVFLSDTRSETASRAISRALTGNEESFAPLPGGALDHLTPNKAMVTALWPVLWGHAMKDIFGQGAGTHKVGVWAGQNVIPEGPLPPIRISDQPYGLLPVTSLNLWEPFTSDPDFEVRLNPFLIRLRGIWAAIARGTGNIFGANTELILQLLGRNPSSNGYAHRSFVSLELLQLLYGAFVAFVPFREVDSWWKETGASVLAFDSIVLDSTDGLNRQRTYGTLGWPQDLKNPLVVPRDLPPATSLKKIIDDLIVNPLTGISKDAPRSLLITLLQLSLIINRAEVVRVARQQRGPALEPVKSDSSRTNLESDAAQINLDIFQAGAEASQLLSKVQDAATLLSVTPVPALERILIATLDTAAYRLDPWITAFAWRRLESMRSGNSVWLLGIYGWVDAPFLGTPGPTAGGLLHAPSEPQALTAAILRDKAINDPEPQRWNMNLESETIRIANRIAEEVQLGSHLCEVLGREVERIVSVKATIDILRMQFPIRSEHQGRRVCDGEKVLKANLTSLTLTDEQRGKLQKLREALDVYGDLLVAESVHHVVSGRADVAGAVMDAAAGLKRPPSLDVVKTPRAGRDVSTSVLVALPAPPAPVVSDDVSPAELAEPAVAAFLVDVIGSPSARPWRWEVLRADQSVTEVFLANLQLAPIDSVMISEEALNRLIVQSVPDGVSVLNPETAEGVQARRLALRILNALSGQPGLIEDMVDDGSSTDDQEVRDELSGRYDSMRGAALSFSQRLNAARTGTPDQRVLALRAAARWGITPVLKPFDTLEDQFDRARQAFNARRDASPATLDPAQNSASAIAAAIARLASSDGQLPIFSRIRPSAIPTQLTKSRSLDDRWLNVVAVVRLQLARLEAFQMESIITRTKSPLIAWTNRPDDPWQANPRRTPDGDRLPSRLVVAYSTKKGLRKTTNNRPVAVGLLDSWTEVVPDTEHSTTVAFGFNAPKARPPQAILLAVPPNDQPMNSTVLVKILEETRELARARMASPDDLHAFDAGLPLAMLPFLQDVPVDL
jgi:hypothetical protein